MNYKQSLIYCCFLAVLCSCDVSTHKYISFETDDSDSLKVYVSWATDTSSISDIYAYDTAFHYNKVSLLFFKDNSTLQSFTKPGYEYLGDIDNDGDEDSVKTTFYYFDVAQADPRVEENDSVQVTFFNRRKIVGSKVLYKKVYESSFADRLPLPKLH